MTRRPGVRLEIPTLLLGIIVLVGIVTTAWFLFHEKAGNLDEREPQGMDARPTGRSSAPPTNASPASKPIKEVVLMPVARIASSLNSPETDVEQDLSTLEMILREYRRQYQGNPSGENIEISAALMGDNDRGLGFIPRLGRNQINAQGELIDRWSTPYFFHVESSTEMEIRSAGQDGEFYTEDDAVSSPLAGE